MSDPQVHLIGSVPGLATPPGYSYVASSPDELAFFAGQVGLDEHGEVVGRGDFAAQVERSFANLGLALAAAGCTPAGVLLVRYYVVGLDRERLLALRGLRNAFFGESRPASTLIGVAVLFDPDVLVEIEVMAARRR